MAALDKPSDIYGAGDGPEWRRRVAVAVNWLLGTLARRVTALEATDAAKATHPFQSLAAAPVSPTEGQTYFDTVTKKARTYDGTIWNDLF